MVIGTVTSAKTEIPPAPLSNLRPRTKRGAERW